MTIIQYIHDLRNTLGMLKGKWKTFSLLGNIKKCDSYLQEIGTVFPLFVGY